MFQSDGDVDVVCGDGLRMGTDIVGMVGNGYELLSMYSSLSLPSYLWWDLAINYLSKIWKHLCSGINWPQRIVTVCCLNAI